MLSNVGMHVVAGFYSAVFVLGVVIARLAGLPNVFTTHPVSPSEAAVRLVGGVALGVALAGLSALSSRFLASARRLDASLASALGPVPPSDALMMALFSGLAEEVLFRGALQGVLGLWPASLLFCLAHLPPRKDMLAWTVTSGVVGVGLGVLTIWTGDILCAIAIHATVNAINITRLGRMAAAQQAHPS